MSQERITDMDMLSLIAIETLTTCGPACWQAREDTCRCSCAGKQHGCLRNGTGEQPVRTRRVGAHWWELAAITAGHREAQKYIDAELNNQGLRRQWTYAIKSEYGPHNLYAICPATKAQVAKWPELAAHREGETIGPTRHHALNQQPCLIWRRKGE